MTYLVSWNSAEKLFERNFGFDQTNVNILSGGIGTYDGWREYEYVHFSTSDSRQLYDYLSARNYGYPPDYLENLCKGIAKAENFSLKGATIRYKGAQTAPHEFFVSYMEHDDLLDVFFIKAIKD